MDVGISLRTVSNQISVRSFASRRYGPVGRWKSMGKEGGAPRSKWYGVGRWRAMWGLTLAQILNKEP